MAFVPFDVPLVGDRAAWLAGCAFIDKSLVRHKFGQAERSFLLAVRRTKNDWLALLSISGPGDWGLISGVVSCHCGVVRPNEGHGHGHARDEGQQ